MRPNSTIHHSRPKINCGNTQSTVCHRVAKPEGWAREIPSAMHTAPHIHTAPHVYAKTHMSACKPPTQAAHTVTHTLTQQQLHVQQRSTVHHTKYRYLNSHTYHNTCMGKHTFKQPTQVTHTHTHTHTHTRRYTHTSTPARRPMFHCTPQPSVEQLWQHTVHGLPYCGKVRGLF